MHTYESIIILRPQVSDNEVAEFVDKTKKFITHEGGESLGDEKLGRRRLTHAIKHIREGFYVYLKFRLSPQNITKLNTSLRLNETVMRSMVIKQEPEPVKAAAAAK